MFTVILLFILHFFSLSLTKYLFFVGFRVNYDYQTWKHIIHLAKNKVLGINRYNSALLLDNALYFLIKYPEKEISTDTNNDYNNNNDKSDDDDLTIFFDLASNLLDNESYCEWYPMFSALEHVSTKMFPHDTDIKVITTRICYLKECTFHIVKICVLNRTVISLSVYIYIYIT